MNKVLEIKFSGWTATPRLPFVLSGNSVCMHTPSYSLILGIIGCCLGRIVSGDEVHVGFTYSYNGVASDLETRNRLEYDGKKIKAHSKGTDAYAREFHIAPELTIWIDRLDWKSSFLSPVGTPSLGRSQDILKIESVREVEVVSIPQGEISGCMIPFYAGIEAGGQLVQLAESYQENEEIGGGRKAEKSTVFLSIPHDNKVKLAIPNLYQTREEIANNFYLHKFNG